MKARLEAKPESDLTADDPLRRVLIAEMGEPEEDLAALGRLFGR